MEITSINKDELQQAFSQRTERKRGLFAEVVSSLNCLKPGESLKISFKTPKEAKSCRSQINTGLKKTTIDNGNLCSYKAFRVENIVYVYSTRVEFKAK